jgi:hypothetical protein
MAHGNVQAFKESNVKNHLVVQSWLNRIVELALCVFEYHNVPDTIDIRYLEKTLITKGCAAWFRDDVTGALLALQGVTQGQFDVYGNPRIRQAVGYNGYTRTVSDSDSVLMWNNYQRVPSYPVLLNYARQIADIERIIEVNVSGQKTPKIIQCSKDQFLSFKNIEMKTEGNQKYIFIDNELNPNLLKVLDMTVPYVADKLYDIKNLLIAECLSYIGIPANAIEKKERINLLELELSNANTDAQRYTRLISRQEALEAINKMFGTNISVEFRFKGELMNDERIHTITQTVN